MPLLRRSADYSVEATSSALAECDWDIAAQEAVLTAAALEDPAEAQQASVRLLALGAKRKVLAAVHDAAMQAQRQAEAEASRSMLMAQHRSASQHAGAIRRAAEQMQEDIAALAGHWGELKTALGRLSAVVGNADAYPQLNVPELRQLAELEAARIGCAVAQHGLVTDMPGARVPRSGTVIDLAPLAERVAELTSCWLRLHKATLGLADG